MSALGLSVANDIASAALIWYVRGNTLSQTTQDKPLLAWLRDGQKKFSSGNLQISEPVQGAYMSDTAGFLQGFSEDDSINFAQASNILRAVYNWKEVIASLIITWTELLKDGISIYDDSKGGRKSEHSEVAMTRITGLMENRMDDFGESWSRAFNTMLWADGTQDAKQVPGILALLPDTYLTGTTGGLNKATYPWWRQRVNLTLTPSAQNSSVIQFFNSELLQLRRFGGRPNKALCGSAFLDGLRLELFAKGYFTMEGFQGEKATDLGMGGVHITGMGKFEYDPTLDSTPFAASKRCYVMDGRRIRLRPMEGEDNKILSPERPYQYLVFLHSMKWTGALEATQLNSNGIYGMV
jgi:hypothetical protein